MKLCKDCKHAVLPSPLQNFANYSGSGLTYLPMCGHPEARRSVVDGSLKTFCEQARGVVGSPYKSICGPDAVLFEQAPPTTQPELKPYAVVPIETERDRSFWQKAKKWFI